MSTKSLTSGMNLQADDAQSKKTSFTPGEIRRIIKTCVESGVTHFEHNGLKMSFSGNNPEYVANVPRGTKQPKPDHEKQAKEALESEELLTKEEQIAMLVLEDPVEFERQLAAGELEEMIDDATDDNE